MSASGYEVVDTTTRAIIQIALGALGLLGFAFLYALVLEPWLRPPSLAEHPAWLATFVVVLSIAFMGFILVYGPSRFIRIRAEPAQPFLGRSEVLERIRSQDREDVPFEIVSTDRYDLLVRFRLQDAHWRGALFRGGVRSAYWLYLRLDEARRMAWIVEKRRTVRWDAGGGPGGVTARIQASIFYGITLGEMRRELVYDPLSGFRKVSDTGYDLEQVKAPVVGALVQCGWTVGYKIVPWQVRRRR